MPALWVSSSRLRPAPIDYRIVADAPKGVQNQDLQDHGNRAGGYLLYLLCRSRNIYTVKKGAAMDIAPRIAATNTEKCRNCDPRRNLSERQMPAKIGACCARVTLRIVHTRQTTDRDKARDRGDREYRQKAGEYLSITVASRQYPSGAHQRDERGQAHDARTVSEITTGSFLQH